MPVRRLQARFGAGVKITVETNHFHHLVKAVVGRRDGVFGLEGFAGRRRDQVSDVGEQRRGPFKSLSRGLHGRGIFHFGFQAAPARRELIQPLFVFLVGGREPLLLLPDFPQAETGRLLKRLYPPQRFGGSQDFGLVKHFRRLLAQIHPRSQVFARFFEVVGDGPVGVGMGRVARAKSHDRRHVFALDAGQDLFMFGQRRPDRLGFLLDAGDEFRMFLEGLSRRLYDLHGFVLQLPDRVESVLRRVDVASIQRGTRGRDLGGGAFHSRRGIELRFAQHAFGRCLQGRPQLTARRLDERAGLVDGLLRDLAALAVEFHHGENPFLKAFQSFFEELDFLLRGGFQGHLDQAFAILRSVGQNVENPTRGQTRAQKIFLVVRDFRHDLLAKLGNRFGQGQRVPGFPSSLGSLTPQRADGIVEANPHRLRQRLLSRGNEVRENAFQAERPVSVAPAVEFLLFGPDGIDGRLDLFQDVVHGSQCGVDRVEIRQGPFGLLVEGLDQLAEGHRERPIGSQIPDQFLALGLHSPHDAFQPLLGIEDDGRVAQQPNSRAIAFGPEAIRNFCAKPGRQRLGLRVFQNPVRATQHNEGLVHVLDDFFTQFEGLALVALLHILGGNSQQEIRAVHETH